MPLLMRAGRYSLPAAGNDRRGESGRMNVVVHTILKSPGRLFHVPPEEREAILEVLREGLMAQPDVAFVY